MDIRESIYLLCLVEICSKKKKVRNNEEEGHNNVKITAISCMIASTTAHTNNKKSLEMGRMRDYHSGA